MKESLKFVIVGHVDHGKSTLIGRLLHDTNSLAPDKIEEIRRVSEELGRETEFAYLLDHLEEERRQGITIDTTQVFFKTDKREYVIIDAPGHIEFVKNMITGASQAEAALLIVDADEGVKEQTKRHATIIALLGIEQVVVLINKMDLVDYAQSVFETITKEVTAFLSTFTITPLNQIPLSALKGDNVAAGSEAMRWYTGPTVLAALDTLEKKIVPEAAPMVFAVQDVYKVGDKRINVGRVETGVLKAGQAIAILPGEKKTTVRSIEKFLEEPLYAASGESTGMTTTEALFLDRGTIVCEPGSEPAVRDTFGANLFWMSKRAYPRGGKVMFRLATQEISAEVIEITRRINSSTLEVIAEDADSLNELEIGEVIIQTKKPVVVAPFKEVQPLGRFVLVRDENIVAGGIITSVTL